MFCLATLSFMRRGIVMDAENVEVIAIQRIWNHHWSGSPRGEFKWRFSVGIKLSQFKRECYAEATC
jgi:hypothetical protein